MKPGPCGRSRYLAIAVTTLFGGACASSTATEVPYSSVATSIVASQGPVPTTTDAITGAALAAAATTTTTTTIAPDCVGRLAVDSGDRTFLHDGFERTYRLAVPVGYSNMRFAPLIVNFHGFGGSADQHDGNTLMSKLAIKRGFVVITPNSTADPPSWNVRSDPARLDDLSFIHALVADVVARLCIDTARIYATGHANGGNFAAYLACSAPYEFAAVAQVSADTRPKCPDEAQPAMLKIAGTADETSPYVDVGGKRVGAVEVAQDWAEHDGCTSVPTTVPLQDGVEQMTFSGCASGDVVLVTVVGAAHPWPGGSVAAHLAENSEAGKTFSATKAILDFFEEGLDAE